MRRIEQLKKGELFRIGKVVYVYDGYNRQTKKYSSYKFIDICAFREFKKGKLVEIDFEF